MQANDLKYIKHKDIDLGRVKNVKYYDRDTLDYRLYESKKDNYKTLDLSHLNLKEFPDIPESIITNVKYLFLSENKIERLPDDNLTESFKREYNVYQTEISPDTSAAEVTSGAGSWDFLSNGVKIRSSDTYTNYSGEKYIYVAFAESPFKYANAI